MPRIDNLRRQLNRHPGEMRASQIDGLRQYEIRDQVTVAHMLGITRQAVNVAERRALSKIRRALWRTWQDFINR